MKTVWRGARKSGTGRVSEKDRACPVLGVGNDKEWHVPGLLCEGLGQAVE